MWLDMSEGLILYQSEVFGGLNFLKPIHAFPYPSICFFFFVFLGKICNFAFFNGSKTALLIAKSFFFSFFLFLYPLISLLEYHIKVFFLYHRSFFSLPHIR